MPLSDIAVRNAKGRDKAFKLSDGGGLFLQVNPDGGRLWRMAYRFDKKQKLLAFGVYPDVSLADARKRREAAKALLAKGVDPGQAKKADKRASALNSSRTFEAIGREWFALKLPGWVPSYSDRLMSRLEADVFPALGSRPIADIEPPEVLEVIRKVETRGAIELAKREMQVIGQIFRFAIASGRAKRDPTQDLRGALKSPGRQKHHRALPREDLPDFLKVLDAYDGEPMTKLALKLMVLTFVRTTELRAARWSEFEGLDGPEPLWRIPPERMKMRFEHLVPLSPQSVAVLQELRPLAGRSPQLFPSPSKEGFMSNNTMLFAMYRMGYHGRATVHGFRGVASTWLNEAGYHPDWIERQLAHDERDEVRGAYNSAQYLAGRRQMMCDWADFLDGLRRGGSNTGA
ncbi:tyrosine-type recombinase/integrase [Xanthobacter oligotrophicus]|uniref:tyrosine-type recombinase/integrase n=1 Tax=Xanthobacter oligotrophicus TaxID=2607286 RepID=UPI0011F3872E|nr:integrase arm-type DNA-binding domain-containing protein [Xanthobacter oligotrophicus]MCG5236284.1 integrase arm-type DNA-binding domain-containing protein [Xanthobacter oligotrophicus]